MKTERGSRLRRAQCRRTHAGAKAAVVGLAALGVSGCEHRTPGPAAAAVPGAAVAGDPAAPFLSATGKGDGQDEAYAAARRALAEALLGDARWLDVLELDVHERGAELDAEAQPGGGVVVRLTLSESEAAAVLTAFENAEVTITAPEPWRDTLVAYVKAYAFELGCVRRRALFSVECETGKTGDADADLAALERAVILSSAFRGGVPLDPGGKPLRTPGIYVFWNGIPVEDAPIRFGDGVVYSDAQGYAGAEVWVDRAAVDVDALLGPLAKAWDGVSLAFTTRALDPKRWALQMVDSKGSAVEGPARSVFADAMRKAGFNAPKSGDGALDGLVERTSGEVDMRVIVKLDAAFASRAGGGRVWYEGTAMVTGDNPWLRETPWLTFSTTTTASGVGDERASTAARIAVARKAAQTLAKKLKP